MIPFLNSSFCLLPFPAPRLPDWIGLVVASRPESNVIAPLQRNCTVVPRNRDRSDIAEEPRMEEHRRWQAAHFDLLYAGMPVCGVDEKHS